MSDEKKILLHACCGICSADCIRQLQEVGYTPVVYFFNPNIDTKDEFDRRLESQRTVCQYFNTELLVESYCPVEFLNVIKGFENEPERGQRCTLCFKLRLLKTAYKAKELKIPYFTTSIVISPHKNYELITSIGNHISDHIEDIEYVAIDFKKKNGFLNSNKLSKELGLYRQNYCGCKFAKKHLL